MLRTMGAIAGGLLAWLVIVSMLNLVLRIGIVGYREAEPTFAFTMNMMLARLLIAVLTSLAAGVIARAIAPDSEAAPIAVGLALLATFLPAHVAIGARLPLWYHLAFLVTLVPLVWAGGRLGRRPQGD